MKLFYYFQSQEELEFSVKTLICWTQLVPQKNIVVHGPKQIIRQKKFPKCNRDTIIRRFNDIPHFMITTPSISTLIHSEKEIKTLDEILMISSRNYFFVPNDINELISELNKRRIKYIDVRPHISNYRSYVLLDLDKEPKIVIAQWFAELKIMDKRVNSLDELISYYVGYLLNEKNL